LTLLNNSIWTSWPCIFNYSIEKDVGEFDSLIHPKLYGAGQNRYYFNMKKLWTWIIFAFIHGNLLFFFSSYGYTASLNEQGLYQDHWFKTTLSFSCVISVVTLRIFVDTFYLNVFNM